MSHAWRLFFFQWSVQNNLHLFFEIENIALQPDLKTNENYQTENVQDCLGSICMLMNKAT